MGNNPSHSTVGQTDPTPLQQEPFTQMPVRITSDRYLSDADKSVLHALVQFAWNKKASCRPSIKKIAKQAGGKSVRAVQLALRNLEYFGYIRVVPNRSLKTHQSYLLLWLVNDEEPPASPPDPALSPRARESQRVRESRRRARSSGHDSGIGAGVRNYVGAGVRNYAPEIDETSELDKVANGGLKAAAGVVVIDNRPGTTKPPPPQASHTTTRIRERLSKALETLKSGGPRKAAVDGAAAALVTSFSDLGGRLRYCKALWEVARGERQSSHVLEAFDRVQAAMNNRDVPSPGAYFFTILDNLKSGVDVVQSNASKVVRKATPAKALTSTPEPQSFDKAAWSRLQAGLQEFQEACDDFDYSRGDASRARGNRLAAKLAELLNDRPNIQAYRSLLDQVRDSLLVRTFTKAVTPSLMRSEGNLGQRFWTKVPEPVTSQLRPKPTYFQLPSGADRIAAAVDDIPI